MAFGSFVALFLVLVLVAYSAMIGHHHSRLKLSASAIPSSVLLPSIVEAPAPSASGAGFAFLATSPHTSRPMKKVFLFFHGSACDFVLRLHVGCGQADNER
ncbi:unnamed protein product [Citrullus colocynthis]|uniref:Secreted protein n=1 Tax=Citrullus colocynthis TaxID=252529 RepID=A0ABP0YPP3_9ROSI